MRKAIKQGFEEFQLDNKIKNLSIDSITFYSSCCRKFFNFTASNKIKFLHEINESVIKKYTAALIDSGISEHSVNSYLRGIKAFIRYWQDKKIIKYFKLSLIRCSEPVKPTFDINELRRIVAPPANPEHTKAWVMSLLLLSSAVRSSTLCNLRVSDFNFSDNCFILTRTKARKIFALPLEPVVKDVLIKYISDNNLASHEFLFVNNIGNKYTRHTLREALLRYYQYLNVEKSGVHIFRHTFGREYVINGGDAFTLQQLLTHSSIEQSKQYVRLYSPQLAVASSKYNPLAASNLAKLQRQQQSD